MKLSVKHDSDTLQDSWQHNIAVRLGSAAILDQLLWGCQKASWFYNGRRPLALLQRMHLLKFLRKINFSDKMMIFAQKD